MVLEVSDKKDLSVKIQEAGSKLVVIDFYAVWCGPCKTIAPKIEELEKQYPNVVFLKVDVDENEEIAADYDISAMPTFVFIKNGSGRPRHAGPGLQSIVIQTPEALKFGYFLNNMYSRVDNPKGKINRRYIISLLRPTIA